MEETARQPVERYRFIAHGEAVGCGRPPEIGPLTRAQTAYQEQYQAWLTWRNENGETGQG